MKKLLIVIVSLTLNSPLFAATSGVEEAQKVCSSLFSTRDQDNCFKTIKGVSFFQKEAVKICGDIFSTSDKIECLKAIGNQEYTDTALKNCADKFSTKDKLSCLETRGTKKEETKKASGTEVDKSFIRGNLRKALQLIKEREYEKAQALLENTLDNL